MNMILTAESYNNNNSKHLFIDISRSCKNLSHNKKGRHYLCNEIVLQGSPKQKVQARQCISDDNNQHRNFELNKPCKKNYIENYDEMDNDKINQDEMDNDKINHNSKELHPS